jgi:exopolyphosphatase/guanosine-5'-triphosphate,3'-diphosphate pyrophosphatase
MRIGIVDCGTNTFNLLVAEVENGQWSHVFTGKAAVRLGKGGFHQGIIKPERLARGIDVLLSHRETMINFGVERAAIFATAAVREASNASQFLRKAHEVTGIEVIVIDGMREAELIFEGVRQTFPDDKGTYTVMDIGGGSTEFIIGNAEGILWKQSFPLGVSRIQEFLNPSDILTDDETARLTQSFAKVLLPLKEALERHPSHTLIGASGSFDTLTAMIAAARRQSFDPLRNRIALDDFSRMHSILASSTFEQRLALPGMLPMRADTMPLASALIDYVIQAYGMTTLIQSSYALKEGALQCIIEGRLRATNFKTRFTHDDGN